MDVVILVDKLLEALFVDVAGLLEVTGFVDVFSVVGDTAFEEDVTAEVLALEARADELEEWLGEAIVPEADEVWEDVVAGQEAVDEVT